MMLSYAVLVVHQNFSFALLSLNIFAARETCYPSISSNTNGPAWCPETHFNFNWFFRGHRQDSELYFKEDRFVKVVTVVQSLNNEMKVPRQCVKQEQLSNPWTFNIENYYRQAICALSVFSHLIPDNPLRWWQHSSAPTFQPSTCKHGTSWTW